METITKAVQDVFVRQSAQTQLAKPHEPLPKTLLPEPFLLASGFYYFVDEVWRQQSSFGGVGWAYRATHATEMEPHTSV